MRYLNRVVFINSANIKYAEVAIDGNVHFIGTQGVGKSTCLRAILFFYNADKVKLGIEKGKRTFDDYYFPFGNSYIVYEVMRETGPYCVLAFKSQGRTCFRFLDGLYEKNHFIDGSGKVKTWDAVRDGLDKKTTYTRKIDRYEEYRDILYGNNRGLSAEFRKFSLIESRQYQNIPRTIQNVFLNSKLEAEFIKQTIIMSLNEEDVKIELDKYAHHLHDFDVQLSDISKWNEQNRSGEVPVRKQADAVQKLYASIRYLEHDKAEMAAQLLYVHQLVLNELPQSEKDHELIMEKRSVQQQKLHELDHKFQQKREEIKKEIHILENDLKKVKQKSDEYERLGIHDIIARVSKKTAKERELKHLKEEKDLLSAKFKEVDVYYQALIKQEENVFNSSVNELQADKNKLETDLLSLKNTICLQYQELLDEIRQQNKENLKAISNSMAQKKDAIHELKSKKQKASLQRYFEKEIDETNQEFITLKEQIKITAFEAADQKKQIETLQKQWELDTERNTAEIETKADKINEENAALNNAIALIDEKLARHGDSFYGWLSDHVPDWQNTIGKVVDEDMVLFHSGLSPAISSEKNDTLFGVKIDVSEINKTVKSVEDHQHERSLLLEKISGLVKRTDELNEQKNEYSEKLKRKYQPKIKELKDAIYQAEYANEKAENDLQRNRVRSLELKQKAEAEKNNAISALNAELEKASDELIKEEQNFSNTENTGQKQLEQKEKEKKKKIQAEELLVNDKRNTLVADFEIKKQQNNRRIAELKEQQVKELLREGADTNRLTEIERKIIDLESELVIIENDRNKVVEYNKDKKELFDHEDRFKAEKKLKESQLGAEQEKYSTQKNKLQNEIDKLSHESSELYKEIETAKNGLKAFEQFQLMSHYNEVKTYAEHPLANEKKQRADLKTLIDTINERLYTLVSRYSDLQAAVNKFLGNFSVDNIFGFKTNLVERQEFREMAEKVQEFVEEDKISVYEKRVNERFAHLIRLIGKETTELISKESEIQKVIRDINTDFEERNFAGVIKSIKLQLSETKNKIVSLLQEIKRFNDDNLLTLGQANLFTTDNSDVQNKKAIVLLKEFAKEIGNRKEKEIGLSDSFELHFRIVENDNDSGWVEKLANVGSEGTDILVKAMINIMLLNVFKDSASKRFKDFRLHCMMDEIGKLHPNNVKGILRFANDRNILLINSSPTSYNASDYRYTYLLSKDNKNVTTVKRLIKKGADV